MDLGMITLKRCGYNLNCTRKTSTASWILLTVNYATLFIGSVSSSLLSRFYFVHGGSNRWVSTLVQSVGFPLLLLPIFFFSYRYCSEPNINIGRRRYPLISSFTTRIFVSSILMGFFSGINNFFISWGVSYLPVSTSSLLLSCQLAFNLLLSVLLVKQKIKFSNLNCVVLLTLSSVLLAHESNSDRPDGVTNTQFYLGFLATLAAAIMFAVYLPIMEIVYRGIKTYTMVMEIQFVMEAAATIFALVGMIVDVGGFGEMVREGRSKFDMGETSYWVTIVATTVCWQLCFMGTAGLIFLTSSLNSGICTTAILSVNVLGGVLMFGDSFGGLKVVSLILCLWGFASYLYGEYRSDKEGELVRDTQEDEEEEILEEGCGERWELK